LTSAWGGVLDTSAFGTDKFVDFIHSIGSNAYISLNVGSGTPAEAADWLDYMTAAEPTASARERAANGHPDPYEIRPACRSCAHG
jgi:alpha-N-arabinofuranosidase